VDGDNSAIPTKPNRLPAALYVGPVLLFVAAAAYGVLEVHPANDTWIGLAAGRQILTADRFPLTDTFSYTAAGRVWYNQNWLTHVLLYWLYDSVSPDAVIYGTWTLAGAVFVLTLLAAYWRSGTWLGALLAASVTALGCRDFLSARPATIGFFCLAGLWALLSALEGQGDRRRWWPIVLLLPLLLVWGNAHGSFVFGYGVLGLYVIHWGGVRWFRLAMTVDGRQIVAIVVAVATALILTVVFGPFGIQNFIHGGKVAGSAVWRDVAEWQPPYVSGHNFPPVWRFWTILGGSAGLLLACAVLRLLLPKSNRPYQTQRRVHVTLFDAAMVLIGLAMTLWARRFAPVFLILAAPIVLTAVVLLLRPLEGSWRRNLRSGLAVVAGLLGVGVAVATGFRAHADLVAPYADRHDLNLLERVTTYDIVPHDALIFIEKNKLRINLLAEWSLAGAVMLHAPSAKVFIDGRAQQVYDESQYRKYQALFVAANTPHQLMFRILDESQTDGVLLRCWERGANLRAALEQSPSWVPVLLDPDYRLFLRVGSRGLEHLGAALRAGQAWWPKSSAQLASQAFVWQAATPPDLERAVANWELALRKNLALGSICFRPLTEALLELGRDGEARQRLEMYTHALNQPFTGLSAETRGELLETLAACGRRIEAATSGRSGKD
jgi:hypothetical protein